MGLIGFGLGGESFHAPLIAVTPGMELATIVTSNPERRRRAASTYPRAKLCESSEQLLERPADLDLVVVTTPNRTHVPLALAALQAGLGVVVDKPFAANVAEARQVIATARESGQFLSVYHNRRWDSEFRTLKRLLNEGAIGEVLRFESRLDRWRPLVKDVWRERAAPEEAGGLLYDLGTHLIDQALQLFGPVGQVYAELDQRRPGGVIDDDMFLALTHESGVRSHLSASIVAAQPGARMRVLGTSAAYVKQQPDQQEAHLRAGMLPNRPDWGAEPENHWGLLGVDGDVQPVRSEPGAYQQFYAEVATALREDSAPPVDPEDAVQGLEIIAAAHRSATEHRTISMGVNR